MVTSCEINKNTNTMFDLNMEELNCNFRIVEFGNKFEKVAVVVEHSCGSEVVVFLLGVELTVDLLSYILLLLKYLDFLNLTSL